MTGTSTAAASATANGNPTATDEKLNWLLENLLQRTPGARHALVLSRDGLKLCRTPELSVDQADQLAAISAGIQSLRTVRPSSSATARVACGPPWPSSTAACC